MVLQLAARMRSAAVNVRCQMTGFPKKQSYNIQPAGNVEVPLILFNHRLTSYFLLLLARYM